MPDASAPSAESEVSELVIKRILLLDDDLVLAETLQLLLESNNFVVTTVSNGLEGLREIMDSDFDIIVCDLQMPKMPGDMFYLAVQAIRPHLCPRFVFITGHSNVPKIAKFLDEVDALVVFKPARNDELINMISLAYKRGRDTAPESK